MKIRESGITLIALVVTIVVLLILAGVSISMLTGENGIISQANEANLKNNHGTVLEALRLKVMDYFTENEENLIDDELILLKNDEIIDENYIVNVEKLLNKKLSTGNGSENKDVYVIEENHLYYYDKNGEGIDLGNIGDLEGELQTTDPSLFEISDDGTITIKDYMDYYEGRKEWTIENLVIPSKINGIEVKKIGDNFFKSGAEDVRTMAYSLKNVVIPDTVVVIGDEAFRQCKGLETITIPKSVKIIEAEAFCGCSNLKNVIYNGSMIEWNFILIGGRNEYLTSANIKYEVDSEEYQKFAQNYLSNKDQEELEELILKTYFFIGTYEEFLQEKNIKQEAEEKGVDYIEYLKEILINDENSWLTVEYLVSTQGGEGKTTEELEQMYVEKIGFTGSFNELLSQSGMTREYFMNMIKENGFRTEEDYLKYLIVSNIF